MHPAVEQGLSGETPYPPIPNTSTKLSLHLHPPQLGLPGQGVNRSLGGDANNSTTTSGKWGFLVPGKHSWAEIRKCE